MKQPRALVTEQKPYVLELEIPGLPKTTNSFSRMGWQVKHRYTRRWKELVRLVAGPHVPSPPCQKAKLTLTRHSSREPDFDGLVSSFKCVVDALVEIGVLENDKQSNIGQPTYRWEKAKLNNGKISIRVEGIE